MNYITLPLSLFFIFVAPLWLILYYRSGKQTSLSEQDKEELQRLLARTEQMQKRIISLEKILDAQAPQWRQK